MKQKLIVAGLIGCIIAAGCKSRFTSTADASGPRKYENADPSFVRSTTDSSTHVLTGVTDSGSVGQKNLHTDSVLAMPTPKMVDSVPANH